MDFFVSVSYNIILEVIFIDIFLFRFSLVFHNNSSVDAVNVVQELRYPAQKKIVIS